MPTTFNLQKCYHPVSFICAWSMPQHKIKRKEKYSSNEAELSLLVYLPYLFMLLGQHFLIYVEVTWFLHFLFFYFLFVKRIVSSAHDRMQILYAAGLAICFNNWFAPFPHYQWPHSSNSDFYAGRNKTIYLISCILVPLLSLAVFRFKD